MIGVLTDPWFAAEFIGEAEEKSHRLLGASIEGAQGLFLWCPCGFNDPRYRLPNGGRPHGCLIAFANPRNAPPLPPSWGPSSRHNKDVHPRWNMIGTGLHDLTLTPSVAIGDPECWHGFITNGQVT